MQPFSFNTWRSRRWLSAMAFTILIAVTSVAPVRAEEPQDAPPPSAEARREEMREAMLMALMVRIRRELELDQETTFKVFTLVENHSEKLREHRGRMKIEFEKLEDLTEKTPTNDSALNSQIDKILGMHGEMQDLETQFFTSLEAELTPVQRAKLMLMYGAFKKRIGDAIEGRMQQRLLPEGVPRPGRGRGIGRPSVE